MNSLIRFGLVFWALLAMSVPRAFAQTGAQDQVPIYKISVRHIGPPAVSDSLIMANIRVEQGARYTQSGLFNATDDDVHNLLGTGYFFNVRVIQEFSSEEGIHLIYIVQGNPLLTDIRFEENTKFKDSKLLKTIASKVGLPMSELRLHEDAAAIQKLYQKKGYTGTKVIYDRSIDEQTGRAVVTFRIDEAGKVRITDVIFEGAHEFSQHKLRKVIKTRRWWWLSWLTGSGVFKEDEYETDRDSLTRFYLSEGYLDFEIKDVLFDYPEPDRLILRFQIFEGRQYQVGTVGFKGATLISTNALEKNLQLTPGKTFTPPKLYEDIETLEDAYGRYGYIDTRVNPRRTPNVSTGNMDLVYDIQEGEKIFIERIEIRGNAKTKDTVIRRELAVTPGEVFNKVLVKVSTNRLGQLGYFGKISAEAERTELPNRRNLVVNVEEINTGSFNVGAGLSSIDALVGFVEVSQSNFDLFNPPYFTGGGQKISMRVQLGTQRKDYVLSFQDPWFFGRKLIFSTDLYHRDLGFESSVYDQISTGISTALTRPLFSDWVGGDWLRGTLSYTMERVTITDVPNSASPAIKDQEGSTLVSSMGVRLAYDHRGPGILPSKGFRTVLDTGFAGGPLGADADFYRWELRHAHYFRGLAEGHVLELLGRIGVVQQYGDSTEVPIFERWYLGGAFNMRGFKYREVGPKDFQGEPLGGSTYWFASAEYSIPIIERVRLAAFYDIGMVYQDGYSFNPNFYDRNGNAVGTTGLYNDDVGIGIRLNLPIGPLVFDYGIPLTSDRFNESSGQFQFRAGYQRDF
jgi:outer membrane protein insertion porin family